MEKKVERPSIEAIDYNGMIVIGGDLFEFDKARTLLIDHADHGNTCRIMDLLASDAIKGAIDVHSRKLSSIESLIEKYGERYADFVKVIEFSIPRPIIFRGNTLTESMINYYNEQSINKKNGYILVDEPLNKKLNGEFPKIELYGMNYQIDINKCKLNPDNEKHPPLRFPSSALTEPSEIFYNIFTNKQEWFPMPGQDFPHGVVILQFPPLSHLDIINYAKMAGLSATALVCDFPWKADPSSINRIDHSEMKVTQSNQKSPVKKESTKPESEKSTKKARIRRKRH